jgi:hypothetical protein
MIAACFICFWIFMMLFFGWSVVEAFKQGSAQVRRMHQIPCHKCDFFTNDFRLKCTVHPSKACTEEAIDCIDFELKSREHNYRERPFKFD